MGNGVDVVDDDGGRRPSVDSVTVCLSLRYAPASLPRSPVQTVCDRRYAGTPTRRAQQLTDLMSHDAAAAPLLVGCCEIDTFLVYPVAVYGISRHKILDSPQAARDLHRTVQARTPKPVPALDKLGPSRLARVPRSTILLHGLRQFAGSSHTCNLGHSAAPCS